MTEAKSYLRITSTDATDDGVIEDMVEQASRAIDVFTGGQWYASTETRYFDVPLGVRRLELDKRLQTISTNGLVNGNAAVIASTEYNLWPKNQPPYRAIVLRQTSAYSWLPNTYGDDEVVIAVTGTWGDLNRAGTDAWSVRMVEMTAKACLAIVSDAYHKRFGKNDSGAVTVTASGVVITPQGLPQDARDILAALKHIL